MKNCKISLPYVNPRSKYPLPKILRTEKQTNKQTNRKNSKRYISLVRITSIPWVVRLS